MVRVAPFGKSNWNLYNTYWIRATGVTRGSLKGFYRPLIRGTIATIRGTVDK